MTSRERILAVLRGQKPDRVPWIPLCSWTYFESLPEYSAGSDWMNLEGLKTRVEFYKEIGADYWQWNAFPYYTDVYCMLELRTNASANIELKIDKNGNTIRTEYNMPVGKLVAIDAYSKIGHTTYHDKDLVETVEDMKVFEYVVENIGYEPDHDGLAKQLEIVGENGVMCIASPPPPLKSFLLGAMRLDKAIYMIMDHKAEFDQLVKVVDVKNVEIYQMLAESPATVFVDAAVSGLGMISPKIFEEYYMPYTKKYADILHKAGKLYVNHTSGEPVGDILEMLKKSGIDGLYGLTYPPTVDTIISEVNEAFGGQIAVMGGMPSDFIATKTAAEVQDKAIEVLAETSGCRFMLGTVDDTPYGTPQENLKAVSEAVQQWDLSNN